MSNSGCVFRWSKYSLSGWLIQSLTLRALFPIEQQVPGTSRKTRTFKGYPHIVVQNATLLAGLVFEYGFFRMFLVQRSLRHHRVVFPTILSEYKSFARIHLFLHCCAWLLTSSFVRNYLFVIVVRAELFFRDLVPPQW